MKAKLVGGPKDGWVYDVADAISTIELEGIDFEEGVPLRDQRVVARPGKYVRTHWASDTFAWESIPQD